MTAFSTTVEHPDGRHALAEALHRWRATDAAVTRPDLAFLFASADYMADFATLAAAAADALRVRVLIGCSGQGIIGTQREVEEEAALTLMTATLPGSILTPWYVTQAELDVFTAPLAAVAHSGVVREDVNAWFVFADPYSLDVELLLSSLAGAYYGTPVVGGIASGNHVAGCTHLFLDGEVYDSGAVAVAIGGEWTVQPVVSQGCSPIGEPWTITAAMGSTIKTIANQPALEVLVETLHSLPDDLQQRAQRNLAVGLAVDEYRETFGRGDFLIRNLVDLDRQRGTLTIVGRPRPGQTVQFQMRDAASAEEDLRELLAQTMEDLGGRQPTGALLCSCNGRGLGLFGYPHHDAAALARCLGPIPTAGFFCNGEIGPVGADPFVHGFTASIGLLVRKP